MPGGGDIPAPPATVYEDGTIELPSTVITPSDQEPSVHEKKPNEEGLNQQDDTDSGPNWLTYVAVFLGGGSGGILDLLHAEADSRPADAGVETTELPTGGLPDSPEWEGPGWESGFWADPIARSVSGMVIDYVITELICELAARVGLPASATSEGAAARSAVEAEAAAKPVAAPAAEPPVTQVESSNKMSDKAIVQSHANYANAVEELEMARSGKALTPMAKGKAVEERVAQSLNSNPVTREKFIHLGGPNKPDFIPRTPEGLEYDFVHNTNYDVFPLNRRQINAHYYGRFYGHTMEGIFYLNPPGQSRPWLYFGVIF